MGVKLHKGKASIFLNMEMHADEHGREHEQAKERRNPRFLQSLVSFIWRALPWTELYSGLISPSCFSYLVLCRLYWTSWLHVLQLHWVPERSREGTMRVYVRITQEQQIKMTLGYNHSNLSAHAEVFVL